MVEKMSPLRKQPQWIGASRQVVGEVGFSRIWSCLTLTLLLLLAAGNLSVHGQCMLANPSFELTGSGGMAFAGWNQFGAVGSVNVAPHGAAAARVTGPNTGGWDVSAFWQRLDTAPGKRWSASVQAGHSATNPLTGQSRAILNIEWRNANGDLISYESHTVADPAVPPGSFRPFTVESQPAPPGTVATHFLLGVLQGPTDPAPDVFYDQATFEDLGPPTIDQLQWVDFPGGRTIDFSGRTWRVKGPGYYGPGPNLFCETPSCVWVAADDRLHLTIQRIGGSWYSTEVALEEPLGYGDYIFTTVGRLDSLDPRVVLGLFLWQYGRCYDPAFLWWNPYNEIDVEFSRWGVPGNPVGQFVAQPYDYPGNISRFSAGFSDGELTSHAFRWSNDRVEFRSWRGGPQDETPQNLIHTWTYTGPHIPRPDQPRVHINLWQFDGPPGTNQEVVIDQFTFVPGNPADVPLPQIAADESAATPNPFTSRTAISFSLPKAGPARVLVYDASGRLVRTLANGSFPAGIHEVTWNGRDDAGSRVASGLYFAQVRSGGVAETKRVVLLR